MWKELLENFKLTGHTEGYSDGKAASILSNELAQMKEQELGGIAKKYF